MTITNKAARICSAGAKSLLALVTVVVLSERTAAQDEIYHFDIGEQKLTTALLQFSEQSDTLLVMHTELIADRSAPEVKGDMPAAEALEKLLEGSGLEYSVGDDGGVTVVHATQTEDSNSGKVQPTLMAQASADRNRSMTTENEDVEKAGLQIGESIRGDDEGAVSVITGKVTDARTGANLKGALVTIEETGQWTSTGDLGRFRFASVPSGSVTLTVSFLGYAGQSAVIGVRGDSITQDFALRGGSEIEEIVVYGQRSARAQALNIERTSDVASTVVASDLLTGFPGVTVSDSLRRVPGVAFTPDRLTGDGSNVIIRGLEPNLNAVKLNGIELPIEQGGRSATLSNVLSESVDKITISKSLLPSHDSAGTGGLIEIETRGPLDRPRDFISAAVDYGSGEQLDELNASLTASTILGAQENFGVSASVQYRDRENEAYSYGTGLTFGEYLPLGPRGTPTISSISFIDPLTPFPFERGVNSAFSDSASYNSSVVNTENLGINVSGQFKWDQHSDFKLAYQYFEGDSHSDTSSISINAPLQYALQPVQVIGGEPRYAIQPSGFFSFQQNYSISENSSETEVISFEGQTVVDEWQFDYLIGRTEGTFTTPVSGGLSFSGPTSSSPDFLQFIDPSSVDEIEDRVLSYFPARNGGGYPIPFLSPEGFDAYNNPANFNFSSANWAESMSDSSRTAFELDVKRSFGSGPVKYVSAGVSLENTEASNFVIQDQSSYFPVGTVTVADLGLAFSSPAIVNESVPANFLVISPSGVATFFSSVDALTQGSSPLLGVSRSNGVEDNPLITDAGLEEDELSAYLEVKTTFGNLDVIGGFRWSQYDITANRFTVSTLFDASFVFDPVFQQNSRRVDSVSETQSEFLPRIVTNYRFSENDVLRFGYYRSLARPSIEDIRNSENVLYFLAPFFGPNFNQPQISITRGNPDLQPSITNNFDFSFERYDSNTGVLKLGVFYKDIKNPLRVASERIVELPADFVLPDDPRIQAVADNFDIIVSFPVNSPFSGSILGVEAAVEKQFVNWPGWASGLGVFANATYTDGEIDEQVFFASSPIFDDAGVIIGTENVELVAKDSNLSQQPRFSGTIAATYNMYGIDGSLAYTYQDARRSAGFSTFYLSQYEDSVDSLDLRIEYRFDRANSSWIAFLEGSDLLKGQSDHQASFFRGGENGAGKYVSGRTFRGGRFLNIGLRANF